MRFNSGISLGAFTLAACVAYAEPADATIITVHASGAIGGFATGTGTTATVVGPSGGAFFGLSPASFPGAHADFVWTIDTGQLGASTVNGPNSAQYAYDDPLLASLDGAFVTSTMPIGITGKVTVNGITLSAGVDRQLLYLQQDAFNNFLLRTDTWRAPTVTRDYVDLDITNAFAFLSSLNPLDLVGLSLTPLCANGGSEVARLNRIESAGPATFGAVDLCARGSTFSITAEETPEPSTFAVIAAALSLLGLWGARPFGAVKQKS